MRPLSFRVNNKPTAIRHQAEGSCITAADQQGITWHAILAQAKLSRREGTDLS
jgi:hypothetical protein